MRGWMVLGVLAALVAGAGTALADPIAVSGGPYTVAVDGVLPLDASTSFDDAGGTIAAWWWDLDGDGLFDNAFGATPFVGPGFWTASGITPTAGLVLPIGLRVANAYGQTAEAFTTVTFTAPAVPEPATLALVGLGVAAVGLRRRRRGAS